MNDLLLTIRKTVMVPIHPAGWPFIIIAAVLMLLFWQIGTALGVIGIFLTLWCAYFFRNPARVTPVRPGLIISPADGRVQMIVKVPLPPELDDMKGTPENPTGDALCDTPEVTRGSIFLNVFNVHVQRIPAFGEVRKVVYRPGKFFNASLDKASVDNERSTVLMKLDGYNTSVAFVQIAGLVAKRIICKLASGQKVRAGDLYGLIRFGSRVDVYLPPNVEPLVAVGQLTVGGETVIADMDSREPQRLADLRD